MVASRISHGYLSPNGYWHPLGCRRTGSIYDRKRAESCVENGLPVVPDIVFRPSMYALELEPVRERNPSG